MAAAALLCRESMGDAPGFADVQRPGPTGVIAILGATALVLAACTSTLGDHLDDAAATHPVFGTAEPLSAVVGSELVSSHVVPLTCIPDRTDPVGVFVGLEVVDWSTHNDVVEVTLRTGHARLGSHPSGCGDPTVVLADSMFLLGPDDETLHTTRATESDEGTKLAFDLDGRSSADWSAVLLPTIDYALANGERQTSIYGFVGHYALR